MNTLRQQTDLYFLATTFVDASSDSPPSIPSAIPVSPGDTRPSPKKSKQSPFCLPLTSGPSHVPKQRGRPKKSCIPSPLPIPSEAAEGADKPQTPENQEPTGSSSTVIVSGEKTRSPKKRTTKVGSLADLALLERHDELLGDLTKLERIFELSTAMQ
ncbi:hypothetical protein BV898_20075, partial [Hypsibius exemplaris]